MRRLIFGCGYLGYRVANGWLNEGDEVFAVTRDQQRAAELHTAGIVPIVADVTCPETLSDLPQTDTVLFAVGYDRSSQRGIHDVYVDGLRHVLAALAADTGRVVYVSSTGVYGQRDGAWVDELDACNPTRAGGKACLEAEQLLRDHRLGVRSIILRMGGIYGPGRIPRARELAAGSVIQAPSEGYLNLIHVDDAARVVAVAAASSTAPALYCVCDGHPVIRGDYYRYLAQRIGAPKPRFASSPHDSPAARRAASSKRVSNARLRATLDVRLEYPSYREGLDAIQPASRPSRRK
jgi:nucleoside-diphosphate-sugar epimerase